MLPSLGETDSLFFLFIRGSNKGILFERRDVSLDKEEIKYM